MSDFLHLIRYLYDSLRWRLLIWLSLIVASSLIEGFTLGLFLPIIAGTDSDSPLHAFLTSLFDTLGLRYTLPLALGAVTALYVGRTALVVFQEIYAARAIANLLVEIKTNVVDRLLKADYQYFTRRGIGYFNNAVTVEFTNLTNAFDFCARTLVSAVFTAAYLILALAINPVLAVGLIVFGIPAYILLRMAFRLVQRVSLMNTDNNSLLNSHLIQVLKRLQVLQSDSFDEGDLRGDSLRHRRAGPTSLQAEVHVLTGRQRNRPFHCDSNRRAAPLLRGGHWRRVRRDRVSPCSSCAARWSSCRPPRQPFKDAWNTRGAFACSAT